MSDLDNILARLHKLEDRFRGLETFIGHDGDDDGPVDPAHDRRLTKRQLAQRRGKSTRTVDRDVERGILPAPQFENGRAYWWLSALQRHEREREHGKPRAPRRHFARNAVSA
jgi:hypothetical protein